METPALPLKKSSKSIINSVDNFFRTGGGQLPYLGISRHTLATRFRPTLSAGFAFSLGQRGLLSSTVSLPPIRCFCSFLVVAKVIPGRQVFRLSDDERKLACPSYIEADWCSEEDCKVEVVNCLTSTDYLLDPHTAIAVAVGRRCRTPLVGMIIRTSTTTIKQSNHTTNTTF